MTEKKKQITRNRTSYSCQKCRQRKVKCDKVRPVCGECQKNGEGCVYTATENQILEDEAQVIDVRSGKKRKYSLTTSRDDEDKGLTTRVNLEEQISQLGILLKRLSDIVGIEPNEPVNRSEGQVPAIHSTAHPDLLVPDSQQANVGSSTAWSYDEPTPQSIPMGDAVELDLNRHNDREKSYPNAVLTQLEQLNGLLRTRYADRSNEALHGHTRTVTRSFVDGLEGTDSPFGVPTEDHRNVLFRAWLTCVYPVLPIIDPVEAMLKYRELHFWYAYGLEKGDPNPVEEYIPVIFAIYYAGAVSCSVRAVRKWFPGITRRRLLGMLKKQCLQSLKSPPKFVSGIAVLTARVMMCYMCPESNDEPVITSSTAPLVRMAYSLNLHRERSNESLDSASAELRRRLYWETFNIDTIEATGSNMPPSSNQFYCDTAMLSEIKDSKLETTEAEQYMSAVRGGSQPDKADDPFGSDRTSMVSAIYVFLKAKTILASYTRKLLNINLGAKPKTREDMAQMMTILEEADRLLSVTLDRFPTKGVPELDFSPIVGKPGQSFSMDHGKVFAESLVSNEIDYLCDLAAPSEQWQIPYTTGYRQSMKSFYKWARIALSMILDQCHCFSYAPFLRNIKSKAWTQSRQCALKHSHSCLRKFNSLALDLELERFRWTWPRMFQPIHAAMIILIDAYEKPHSREASRSRALFDQALSLTGPEYGIVGGEDGITELRPFSESGPEAYTMLMQLRAKAWQKADLDPNYLWTEEDQVTVGAAVPLDETEQLVQSIREDRIPDRMSIVSNGQRRSPAGPSLSQRLQQSAEEMRRHPGEEMIPDDSICGGRTGRACLGQNGSMSQTQHTQARPRQLLRARSDQPRTPGSELPEQPVPQPGHHYTFRPPSELYDVHELIRKIKSVQNLTKNATQSRPETEAGAETKLRFEGTSVLPLHQLNPSTDMDHTPLVVENLNDLNSQNHTMVQTKDTLRLDHSHIDANNTTSISTSTSMSTSIPHPPNLNSIPSITTTNQHDTLNPTTQPPLEFDWEKWDEVFGHLMDGGYDEDVDTSHSH